VRQKNIVAVEESDQRRGRGFDSRIPRSVAAAIVL
jgi:hypothetical protein